MTEKSKLPIFVTTECDCVVCSSMCHAPCCGTPEDIEKIIDAGYGDRLCVNDWPNQLTDIHPALKGYESEKAPFRVRSFLGCTFWINGKCELHDKGLKPLGGKVAHHDLENEDWEKLGPYLENLWKSKKGKEVVKKWKKRFLKKPYWIN